MKKLIAILAALMLAFTALACSAAPTAEVTEPETAAAPTAEEATVPTEAPAKQFVIGLAMPDLTSDLI
jgi:hypothetical protein